MDVMSLEHNFGKEIETSLHQLFNYFCNNINLGQWQAAKACLKQLELNKNNFKFDLNSVLIDIIENPEFYWLAPFFKRKTNLNLKFSFFINFQVMDP